MASGMLKFVNRQSPLQKIKKDELDIKIVKHFVMSSSPQSEAEEWSFRSMMFTACPGYVVPSRHTVARMVDKQFEKVKVDLREEIHSDVEHTYHKTGMVVYDHGSGGDRFRTNKLGIAFVYFTNGFEI